MKRIVMVAALAAIVLASVHAQTATQLQGRWYLTEHQTSGMGTHRPGDELWWFDYFIEFNANGTFREMNFWTPEFSATGTWTLSGNTVTLNLNVPDAGYFNFVRTRTLGISADGRTLRMSYQRPGWTYAATFRHATR